MLFFLQGNTSKKNCMVTTAWRKEIIFSTKFADDNVTSGFNASEGSNSSDSEFESELHCLYGMYCMYVDCPGHLPNKLLCK